MHKHKLIFGAWRKRILAALNLELSMCTACTVSHLAEMLIALFKLQLASSLARKHRLVGT